MEKSWMMIMHQIDKEHEINGRRKLVPQVRCRAQHMEKSGL